MRNWILRKKKSKRSSKKKMVNPFVRCFIGLLSLTATVMAWPGGTSNSAPEPPPPAPPPLPVPPPPPTRRSGYSRARFDENFKTARPSSRTKRKRDPSPSPQARRVLLSWSSSESGTSPNKQSIPPKRKTGDFDSLLGEFEIKDEFGTWTFEEYSSNRKGGASFVVNLNGQPLIGDFGKFDKVKLRSHMISHGAKTKQLKWIAFNYPATFGTRGMARRFLSTC